MNPETLLKTLEPLVLRLSRAWKSSLTTHEGEDLAQEARVALWVALPTYDETRCPLAGWANTIVVRHFTNLLEAQQAQKRGPGQSISLTRLGDSLSDGSDPETEAVENLEFQARREGLSPLHQDVIDLILEGYSVPEIAGKTGVSIHRVKQVRADLRDWLHGYQGETSE